MCNTATNGVISHAGSTDSLDPLSLVGRRVLHKFIDEQSQEKWYEGFILGYNPTTKMHEVAYVEEETFHFNLTDDICDGDLKILMTKVQSSSGFTTAKHLPW